MSDVSERLRMGAESLRAKATLWTDHRMARAMEDAARELDRLAAENARLRAVVADVKELETWGDEVEMPSGDRMRVVYCDALRAALDSQGAAGEDGGR